MNVGRNPNRGPGQITLGRLGTVDRIRIAVLVALAALSLVAFLMQRVLGPHVPGDGIPDTPIEAHQMQNGPEK
ncbi:MAG: hypothetical protein ACRDG5_11450 [Anaerolineales bacterium]